MRSEERKLVTVLFADLARSTELVVEHDPEELRALLSSFFEEMSQQIDTYGGTVEKYAGDAIMAVFGVPQIHEDDAERAVRAAFAMRQTLEQLNSTFEQQYDVSLDLRIGIATGMAVATTDDSNELMVTGEVANLAARLQSVDDGIVICEETQRLLEPLLDSQPLSPLELKGFSKPVNAYTVSGLQSIDTSRRGVPGLSSSIVGRDQETETLRRCIEELAQARGQIVSIIGEAGLGKSRLKIELREQLPEGVQWLEGRCYAHTRSTSYGPVSQILKKTFQLEDGEPAAVARTKLRAALRRLAGDDYERVQPAISHLLHIDLESSQGSHALDPQALSKQLVVAMRTLIEAMAGRQPMVLAFEDLHWADAATIELLTVLMELTDFLPLMILVVSRPDVEGGSWDVRFHAQRNFPHRLTEIQLEPLAPQHSKQLVSNLLKVSRIPAQLQDQILEMSEGNPLFVEEIIRSLTHDEILHREGDTWSAAANVGRLAIPKTIQGVISARIDQLPSGAKSVLQTAAIVGRVFTYKALRALVDTNGDLDRSLAHLLRVDLIREQARLPEREYLFKHVLTQEAAYASILHEERKDLHRRFGAHLENIIGESPGEHAAVLAHHWEQAEDLEKAFIYASKAADRARNLYDQSQAVEHYWKALELLDRLPTTPERARDHVGVVVSMVRLPGWDSSKSRFKKALEHLDRAIEIASENDSLADLAAAETAKSVATMDTELIVQAVEHAEESGNQGLWAYCLGMYASYFLGAAGDFEGALEYTDRSIEILEKMGSEYGVATCMTTGGRCNSARAGKLEKSLDYARHASEVADRLDDPWLKAWNAMQTEPYMYKGSWEDVVRVGEKWLPVAWEIGEWNVVFWSSSWLTLAYLKLGRLDDADRVLDRALHESEARTQLPFYLAFPSIANAERRLARGDLDAALVAAEKATELAARGRLLLELGASKRVLAQIQAARGQTDAAEEAFKLSIETLDKIHCYPELGQSLLAYGRFKAIGDRAAGQLLIDKALAIFEDIDATGWIEDAKANPPQPTPSPRG